MKIYCTFLCLLFIISVGSGQSYTVSGSLSGENEVPAVVSEGSGTLTGSYNSTANTITLILNYSDLSGTVTNAHLHKAATGSNGGVIVNLNPSIGSNSGTIDGTYNIAMGDEADLIAGNVYINIHTTAEGSGEIRGQLTLNLLPSSQCETVVEAGDLCVTDNANGIVLKAPNGSCYRIQVNDNGGLITTQVGCP